MLELTAMATPSWEEEILEYHGNQLQHFEENDNQLVEMSGRASAGKESSTENARRDSKTTLVAVATYNACRTCEQIELVSIRRVRIGEGSTISLRVHRKAGSKHNCKFNVSCYRLSAASLGGEGSCKGESYGAGLEVKGSAYRRSSVS